MEKTTIFTNDKKLVKDIETLIEQFHARDIDMNKNKEDYLCDMDLDYIRVNNIKDSKIIIIDSDSFIDIDNNHYYIQVLNPNDSHLNGLDSYIHTDDIKNTIIDLLYAMYGIGVISMDENDVMDKKFSIDLSELLEGDIKECIADCLYQGISPSIFCEFIFYNGGNYIKGTINWDTMVFSSDEIVTAIGTYIGIYIDKEYLANYSLSQSGYADRLKESKKEDK